MSPQATSPMPLDPLSFPLRGSQLIEASAGTGKTWTIAALYVRLVLGHGREPAQRFGRPLRPDEILVMTFTRAATRELSDRIRARLLEAALVFRASVDAAEPATKDSYLLALLADHPEPAARQQAAWRLATAAESMDDAAIHTIDAWCQRMLREHAFDSGSLFDQTLVPDESQLVTEAVQDYWRQQCYPLSPAELARVRTVWPQLAVMEADVLALLPQAAHLPASSIALADLLRTRAQAVAPLLVDGPAQVAAMTRWLTQDMAANPKHWSGSTFKPANVADWLARLADWVAQPDPSELPDLGKGLHRLTPAGLPTVRNKTAPPLASLPPAFAWWQRVVDGFEALPPLSAALREHATAQVARRLDMLKRQANQMGFADLLVRLERALAGPQGERLRERMLRQTPVALIDEFQDTSALQYRLFELLHRIEASAPDSALLLIGDPKQSIYRFRGADIGSYLAARRATAGRHHVLMTNHRSTQALVRAVNHVFLRAEQRAGAGAFGYRITHADGTPDNPLPFIAVRAQGRDERLVSGRQELPALTLVHQLQMANAQSHLDYFSELGAEQVVRWLNDPATGFAQDAPPDGTALRFRRLRPADVAVLVRTGREAQAIRQSLRRRGVASVYLSDRDSVFDSDEAADLLRWLRAVAEPLNAALTRAAWATRLMGLSLAELAEMADDDNGAFEQRSSQLLALQGVWRSQGVLTLLRQTLHQFSLAARWLVQVDGERRLTNFLHLAELLQTASRSLDGEQALIRWLAEEVQGDARGRAGDEAIVRLESDADLVKVVTFHKSKGLEYPLVLVPFASQFRASSRRDTRHVLRPDEQGVPHLDLSPDDDALAWADHERLREDLRLLYVALTRARHALWVGFAALKIGNAAACQNHRGALGRLIGGPEERTIEGWGEALADLAEDCPDIQLIPAHRCWQTDTATDADADSATAHQPAISKKPAPMPVTLLNVVEAPPTLPEATAYQGRFDRRWGIASFSSLVRDAAAGPMPTPEASPHGVRPADDEVVLAPAGTLLGNVQPSQPMRTTPVAVPAWHRFERGALAGNFLHDQLEWLAAERFQLEPEGVHAQRLRLRCERAGRGGPQADDVLAWLNALVRLPLPGLGVSLAEVDRHLPEMEFWLPASRLPAAEVDALCTTHIPELGVRPTLPSRELHGMVMGFADLVVAHQGRYWVLDYKSNQLGPDGGHYTAAALKAAMAAHRYDVQAVLYLLALHRLLRSRLGEAYQPEAQLGGALYLFLRGLDGPERGVFHLAPPWGLLQALDALLDDQTVTDDV